LKSTKICRSTLFDSRENVYCSKYFALVWKIFHLILSSKSIKPFDARIFPILHCDNLFKIASHAIVSSRNKNSRNQIYKISRIDEIDKRVPSSCSINSSLFRDFNFDK